MSFQKLPLELQYKIVNCLREDNTSLLALSGTCNTLYNLVLEQHWLRSPCLKNPEQYNSFRSSSIVFRYPEHFKRLNLSRALHSHMHLYIRKTKLQHLTVGAQSEEFYTKLYRMLSSMTNLKALGLSFVRTIPKTILINIIKRLEHLKILSLRSCIATDDEVVFQIIESCPKLEQLDIYYTNITDESLEAISKNLRKLVYLNINGCSKTTDKGRQRVQNVTDIAVKTKIDEFLVASPYNRDDEYDSFYNTSGDDLDTNIHRSCDLKMDNLFESSPLTQMLS